jgi:potassium large conductance calcium-activated channel subfamily M alpha protein 1
VAKLGMFIYKSYMHTKWRLFWIQAFDISSGVFFVLFYVASAMRNEFNLHRLLHEGRLIDIITVPHLFFHHRTVQDQWLCLGFLRCISAQVSIEWLDSAGLIQFGQSAVTQLICKLVLRLSTLVVCFASSIFVLEVLGEISWGWGPTEYEHTEMGDLSFFTMIYWVIETISTVGYGDFAPKTFLSRLVTAACMIFGVALFAAELNSIMDMIALQKKGCGAFAPQGRSHVVLMGGAIRYADPCTLEPFFQELYNPWARNVWPSTVVMTSVPESAEKVKMMINALLPRHAHQHVVVLVGSPFDPAALKRCRCDIANHVFFLSDTSGNLESLHEDKENILRALSLKNTYPKTPLRLMLLLEGSKQTAVSLGIHPERCFSLSDFGCSLLWLSCRYVGWSAMFGNLVMTKEINLTTDRFGSRPWLQEYVGGLQNSIFGFIPSKEYYNLSMRTLISHAFEQYGVCIVAIQIDGPIVLLPVNELLQITPQTVLFALAPAEEKILPISCKTRHWRDVFLENRMEYYEGEESIAVLRDATPSVTSKGRFQTISAQTGSPSGHSKWCNHHLSSDFKESQKSLLQNRTSERSHSGRMSRKEDLLKSPSSRIDSDRRIEDPEMLTQLEERSREIKRNGTGKPFILLLNLAESWDKVTSFIERNSRTYLPDRMPLVVLCTTAPPQLAIDSHELLMDPGFGCVLGNPSDTEDLIRSGIQECSIIVCLGEPEHSWRGQPISEMLDGDMVLVHRLLHRLGVAHKHLCMEFKQVDNIRLLMRDAAEDAFRDNGDNFCLESSYVSGQILFPRVFSSMIAGAYRTPGIIEVIAQLLDPASVRDEVQERYGLRLVWQLKPKEEYHSQLFTYGEIFTKLLMDDDEPALLFGLLRGCTSGTGADKGYVLTNPSNKTHIAQNDLLFVLGSERFGKMAYDQGLLPFSSFDAAPKLQNAMKEITLPVEKIPWIESTGKQDLWTLKLY